jgi:hypothetical protein
VHGEMLDFLSAGEPAVVCYAASWPRCGSDELDIEIEWRPAIKRDTLYFERGCW